MRKLKGGTLHLFLALLRAASRDLSRYGEVVPKIRGTLKRGDCVGTYRVYVEFRASKKSGGPPGGPYNKVYNFLGSIFGSPYSV